MRYLNTILITIVIILSTGLLVGNRFGFKWTGGDGYKKHASGFVGTEEYKRGETVSSSDDSSILEFCDAMIWMDINTEIQLVDGLSNACEINIIQGRVVITGDITVSTREVKTDINGTTSFVHYSWLDEIEVASLNGESIINVPDQKPVTLNKQAVKIITLPNYSFEYFDFISETSSAADFYSKVFSEID